MPMDYAYNDSFRSRKRDAQQPGVGVERFFGVLTSDGVTSPPGQAPSDQKSSGQKPFDQGAITTQLLARIAGKHKPVSLIGPNLLGGAGVSPKRLYAGTFGTVSLLCVGQPRLSRSTETTVTAAALATRFREVNVRILDELSGPFMLAIFDSAQMRGLVATDRMGIQPVFFRVFERGIAFGSAPADVLVMTNEPTRLSRQAIFDYLFCHVIPAPHSIFEGVWRLLPGQCIEIDRNNVTRRKYWQAAFDEQQNPGFEPLKKNFLDALRSSVADAASGEIACGAFLSGGTDSSTLAGLLTQVSGQPAKTFSIGFAAGDYDEMEYARLASKHFGTMHHEYYVTPQDIVAALPKIATAHPQPFGNSSALPTYFCARLASEHGIERLLGGDGGDELFGGNARYAKQRVFSHYEALPRSLRAAIVEPLCRQLGKRGRLPGIGKIVSYVEQASIPMPDRLETYNLLQRLGYAEVLEADLLSTIDIAEPLRLNHDAYFNPSANSFINRMLSLDFKTTLADSDLPKVMQSCELAGLEVAFPMLDARVVDFSLALPPSMKLKGTQLRYFFKRALSDFLPPAIIHKSKHGFGLPFGQWALSDPGLRELTFDTLNQFKRRHLVRATFIDRLKDDLLPQHPNYYGTMAWILMSFELWLASTVDNVKNANHKEKQVEPTHLA